MKESPTFGDLMFTFHPGDPISESIGLFTFPVHWKGGSGHISHVQTVLDIGANGTIQVMSAESKGLVSKWVIPEEIEVKCFLTYKKPLAAIEMLKIVAWFKEHEGAGYDFSGLGSFLCHEDRNADNRLFCSEACFLASAYAGRPLQERIDGAFISPVMAFISPILRELNRG